MKLACILLNYCDCELTRKAAVRTAGYKKIDYVIIVDNASPTGDYQHLLKLQSDNIAVIESEKNGGYGYGNNLGIKYAREVLGASHVIIANPDVFFSEECVEDIISVFEQNLECAAVAPAHYFRGKLCASKLPNEWQLVFESFSLVNKIFDRKTIYKENEYKNKDSICVEVVVGAMVAYDLKKLGNIQYDEKFFLYCEELVMGYKLREKKLKTIVSLNSNYKHELSHSIDQEYKDLYEKRKLASKSKLIYLRDYLNCGLIKFLFLKVLLKIANMEAFFMNRIIKLLKGKNK